MLAGSKNFPFIVQWATDDAIGYRLRTLITARRVAWLNGFDLKNPGSKKNLAQAARLKERSGYLHPLPGSVRRFPLFYPLYLKFSRRQYIRHTSICVSYIYLDTHSISKKIRLHDKCMSFI